MAMQKDSRQSDLVRGIRLTAAAGATYAKAHGSSLYRRRYGLLLPALGVWVGTLALISPTHPAPSGWVLFWARTWLQM